MNKMQTRGYYFFETKKINDDEAIVVFWCLKINDDDQYYYGYSINEFFEYLDQFKENITLWTYEFSIKKSYSDFIIPFFLKNDNKFNLFNDEKELKKAKVKYSFYCLRIKNNATIKLIYSNPKKKIITFLCATKTLGGNFDEWKNHMNLNYPKIINFNIINEDLILYYKLKLSTLIKPNEDNLKKIGFTGNKYKISMSSNAFWYFSKDEIYNFYFKNKIKSWFISEKIRSSLRGGHSYTKPEYLNKKVAVFNYDRTSAYTFIMIAYPLPVLEPIECWEPNCQHDDSLIEFEIFNFSLKQGKLPILIKVENNVNVFLENGDHCNWNCIKREFNLIKENYNFSDIVLKSKICFFLKSGLCDNYFSKFFVEKQTKEGIEKELAKFYNVILWGYTAQSFVKNNFLLKKSNNKKLFDKEKLAYKTENNEFYYWQENNRFYDPEKFFNPYSAHYVPISIFVTSHQRCDMIEIAQENFDDFVEIETDAILIKSNATLKIPEKFNKLYENLPDWAKKYGLGKFILKPKELIYKKILGTKNSIIYDKDNNFLEAKIAGLSKDINDIDFSEYGKKDLKIKGGKKINKRLKNGGTDFFEEDFTIKIKK